MGCGCLASKPATPALKGKEKIYEDNNQGGYCHENIIFNEQLYAVKGDQLKQLLHRSIGALTFLDKYMKINAGSATLISQDTILTAAHNVYSQEYSSLNEQFKFYIGADGIGEKYYEVEGWRYPKEFQTCPVSSKLQHDYAIMKLKQPIIFEDYIALSEACTECLGENRLKTTLKVYGFPAAYGNFKALDKQANKISLIQYGLSRLGRIADINGQQGRLGYGISTLAGQSGCPVVNNDMIIAVHVGGYQGKYNIGRIIDRSLIQNIREWGKQLRTGEYSIQEEKTCSHHKLVLRANIAIKKQQNKSSTNEESKKQEIKSSSIRKQETKQGIPENNLIVANKISGGDKPFKSSSEKEKNLSNIKTKLQLISHKLKSVDLREYANLVELNLYYNELQQIDLAHCPRLTTIYLSSNQLQQIDTSKNTNLTYLYLDSNKLQKMDVSANTNLTHLWLSYNKLQKMDVSANTNLTHLWLSYNKLQKMDVSANTNLTYLYLDNNKLQKMDVSANTNLTRLSLDSNKLPEIDTTKNTKLESLWLNNNRLSLVRLWIAEDVEEYYYNDYFVFSDQESAACRVQ